MQGTDPPVCRRRHPAKCAYSLINIRLLAAHPRHIQAQSSAKPFSRRCGRTLRADRLVLMSAVCLICSREWYVLSPERSLPARSTNVREPCRCCFAPVLWHESLHERMFLAVLEPCSQMLIMAYLQVRDDP